MRNVHFGLDGFLRDKKSLRTQRIGLVTNDAATTITGVPGRLALLREGFTLTRLFSPEHGLQARGEDGARQENGTDPLTHLPVISLYGDHLQPTAEELERIDYVLFDIPDVGCRFYTYLWTLSHVMEACAVHRKPLILLDRPNPLGGDLQAAEGPALDEAHCSSFIGRWNIPVRHSCTLGELARFFAATRVKNINLEVIGVENWDRRQTALESGWPFVPTSPAIRDANTTLLYPGMGLLEGINVNEGRGTATPFHCCGAPWIRSGLLQEGFASLPLSGVRAMPVSYTPRHGMYAGEPCQGLQLSVTDSRSLRPVHTGLWLIALIAELYADHCAERLYPTVANPSGKGHLDRLTGVYRSFEKIRRGEIPGTDCPDWEKTIGPYLLYP